MSYSEQEIGKQQNEEDNYTNALEDSDVDEITEEMKLICDVESDECRWWVTWFFPDFTNLNKL